MKTVSSPSVISSVFWQTPHVKLNSLQLEVTKCNICPRLVDYCQGVAKTKKTEFAEWKYWGRPVPGFGDPKARLMIIGLAPAAHGGNRTGRVFTGDRSGDFLFKCLYKTGFANQPESSNREDGLKLQDVYITAAVKCAPPDNKPSREEMLACSRYLTREIDLFSTLQGFLCLGQFAYKSVQHVLREKYGFDEDWPRFSHGTEFRLGNGLPLLYLSYHPSPRNTQTGLLTEKMMLRLLGRIGRQVRQNGRK
jgi:uracil-DNA glycosylase family 4